MSDKYTVEVRQVDEYFVEIPPKLLEKVAWKEGDDIKFNIREDGSIHLKKVQTEHVELDFDEEDLLKIMVAAHERGLSLNDFCVKALEEAVMKEDFESECG